MTQEEINEAALEFSRDVHKSSRITLTEDVFKAGVKFAQSKMYSEEDMKEAFKSNYTPFSATNIGDLDKDFNKWFEEQFKKK